MNNLIDENKCLHCGEGKPGYCEECHQKLIAENAELQKERDGIYEDYQDLGKDYHKLDCELEVKDKVIREAIGSLVKQGFCIADKDCLEKYSCEKCVMNYFYGKVREEDGEKKEI